MKTILFLKCKNEFLSYSSKSTIKVIEKLIKNENTYLYKLTSSVYSVTEFKKLIESTLPANLEWLPLSDAYTWGNEYYVAPENGQTFKELMGITLQDLKDQYAQDMEAAGEGKAGAISAYDMKTVDDKNFLKEFFTARITRIEQYLKDIRTLGFEDEITLAKYKNIRCRAISEKSYLLSLDGITYDGHVFDLQISDQTNWNSLFNKATFETVTNFNIIDSEGVPYTFADMDAIEACFALGFNRKLTIKTGDVVKKIAITNAADFDAVDAIVDDRT